MSLYSELAERKGDFCELPESEVRGGDQCVIGPIVACDIDTELHYIADIDSGYKLFSFSAFDCEVYS